MLLIMLTFSSHLLCMQLLKSICIPVLLHAVEVLLPLSKSQMSMLNHVVDRAVYKIIHCGNYDDIQFIWSVMDLPSGDVCLACRAEKFRISYVCSFTWSRVILSNILFCILFDNLSKYRTFIEHIMCDTPNALNVLIGREKTSLQRLSEGRCADCRIS